MTGAGITHREAMLGTHTQGGYAGYTHPRGKPGGIHTREVNPEVLHTQGGYAGPYTPRETMLGFTHPRG